MAFKVEFDVNFAVESDNVVVCYVYPKFYDSRLEELEAVYDYIYDNAPYPMELPEFYKGVAVRKEGDEVDIETAKAIARKKALRAAYKRYRLYTFALLDKILAYWDRSMDLTDALTVRAETMTNEIKALAAGGNV